MCNPVMFLAAGTTMKISGQLAEGRANERAANEQAAQFEYQALVDEDNARAEAALIRRQGRAARGQTVVAAAAAGVKIGEGSAGDAERQVMQDAETDAATAILNGDRAARSGRFLADQKRRAGRDARRASYLEAGATLMSAGEKGYSYYKDRLPGWDAGGFNGTNDRSLFSFGNGVDWWGRNGRGGD